MCTSNFILNNTTGAGIVAKKYWLEIYGCQMNFAEGYALEISLKDRGWKPAETPEEADAVILHTCSVRQTAENRIWGRIGFFKHLKQSNKASVLIVMGCMAERLKSELQNQEPAVDFVVGNYEKKQIPKLLEGVFTGGTGNYSPDTSLELNGEKAFSFQEYHQRENDFHAFVPIMHGCNNFCTYCIVPHVRGREVSRPPEEIVKELQHLETHGVKEITLLGQNVNSYFYKKGGEPYYFTDILAHVLKHIDNIKWVRFLTSHPKDVPSSLIEMIGANSRVCNHIHLPVQHGSSSVLQRMNRKYTREEYMDVIEHIRTAIDTPAISTDIMIGFPGETEKDFQDTLDLMKEVEFDDAFMYYFNPREGTPAARFDKQIEHHVKLERLSEIIALQKEITHKRKKERVGQVEQVLVESVSRKNENELLGRSERDHMVIFPGTPDLIGQFAHVKIETLTGNTLKGTLDR